MSKLKLIRKVEREIQKKEKEMQKLIDEIKSKDDYRLKHVESYRFWIAWAKRWIQGIAS